jgi:hypothetical protein
MNFVLHRSYSFIFYSYWRSRACFTLFLGNFQRNPFILILSLHNKIICFCVFFSFRNLLDVKWTQSSWSIIFHGNTLEQRKKSIWDHMRSKRRDHMWPNFLAAWVMPIGALWAFRLFLRPHRCATWTRTDYIYDPLDKITSVWWKHKIYEIDLQTTRIGGLVWHCGPKHSPYGHHGRTYGR